APPAAAAEQTTATAGVASPAWYSAEPQAVEAEPEHPHTARRRFPAARIPAGPGAIAAIVLSIAVIVIASLDMLHPFGGAGRRATESPGPPVSGAPASESAPLQ